jgi:AraC-like DNA-binding protein
MYAQQSIQDSLFLMFYGAVAMLAVVAGLYLWLRRSNGIMPDITPPRALRRWTAAFFLMAALSHVWWYVLGVYWLTDDRLVRNIVVIALDHVLLVPLVMAVLLALLQDRRHPLWPWALTQVPIVVLAAVGIARRDEFFGFDLTTCWQLAVMTVFVGYYVYALRQYGRWLRENYADLEHKEVWQSLVFAIVLFIVYEVYFTNPGEIAKEYLAQVETVAIIAFLLWRVEVLQRLDVDERLETADDASGEQTAAWTSGEQTAGGAVKADALPSPQSVGRAVRPGRGGGPAATDPSDIGRRLADLCERPQLYLRYDLSLTQLAESIGTSRAALSAWFADHDDTCNAYINRLRIDHFVRLHREAAKAGRTSSVFELAHECGYRSYLSFYSAFRQHMGISVMAWLRNKETK